MSGHNVLARQYMVTGIKCMTLESRISRIILKKKNCPPYLDQNSWPLRRREGDIVHEMGYVSKKTKEINHINMTHRLISQ